MGLGGGGADVKLGRNLVVVASRGDQRHHLSLPLGQDVEVGRRHPSLLGTPGELRDQPPRHGWRQQRIAPGYDANGLQQFRGFDVLHHKTTGTGAERLEHILVHLERGQDQHPQPRQGSISHDSPSRFEAINAGHTDVHQHHVGSRLPSPADGLLAVGRLSDDLDIGGRTEKHLEPGAHERLIVGQQHPDHEMAPFVGSAARTWNPWPGRGPAWSSPRTAAARSRMPARPWPSGQPLASGTPVPRPSSLTSITTRSGSKSTLTRAAFASSGLWSMTCAAMPAWTLMVEMLCDTTSCSSRAIRKRSSVTRRCISSSRLCLPKARWDATAKPRTRKVETVSVPMASAFSDMVPVLISCTTTYPSTVTMPSRTVRRACSGEAALNKATMSARSIGEAA